jgi:single-strand DNA-binding protein
MNAISLVGRLTADPKIVHRDERPICEMRLAVDNGRHPTNLIDVRTFDEQAYVCAEYLGKGERIGVSGRLTFGEWKGEDGKKRHRYSVIGRVEFLGAPPSGERSEPGAGEGEPQPPELVAA